MAGEHAATGIHIVVGIPVVDVPLLVVVVPIDVDENGAACVPEAILITAVRILYAAVSYVGPKSPPASSTNLQYVFAKTRVHTPRNRGRADSGARRFGILMRKP